MKSRVGVTQSFILQPYEKTYYSRLALSSPPQHTTTTHKGMKPPPSHLVSPHADHPSIPSLTRHSLTTRSACEIPLFLSFLSSHGRALSATKFFPHPATPATLATLPLPNRWASRRQVQTLLGRSFASLRGGWATTHCSRLPARHTVVGLELGVLEG